MKPLHPLLLAAALRESDIEAYAAWKQWRDQVDIQNLSWSEIQFLPVLNGSRLNAWLASDEAAGLLKGIVRRAWTEAQVRVALARKIATQLDHAACGPVVILGSAGLHLRSSSRTSVDAIRPVSLVELMISRGALERSLFALQAHGWQLYGEVPSGEGLDWCTHIPLHRNGAHLHLCWRAIDLPADLTDACEEEFLAAFQPGADGGSYGVLQATYAFLTAITRSAPNEVDPLPWQMDCALLLQEEIDWIVWSRIAAAYSRPAFERLSELYSLGLAVPLLSPPRPTGPTLWQCVIIIHHAVRSACHRWLQRARYRARRLLLVEVKR